MSTTFTQSESFAERVRYLRRKKYWSQRQLAHYCGLSQGLIQGIEQGRRPDPTLITLRKLSRALGVSLIDLVGEDDGDALETSGCPAGEF